MSKKPPKVQETATPYTAKKPVKAAAPVRQGKPTIRYATPEQVKKAADEVFRVHEELFRKLAQ